MDPDQLTFDIELSEYLACIRRVPSTYCGATSAAGQPVSMVLGRTVYGKWRWVIKSMAIKMKHTDKDGTWTHCTVSVTLMEYLAQ